jgi:hypothetical protein
MKTLIPDYDYELHLGGTAKPGIKKPLDSRGDLLYLCEACRLDEYAAAFCEYITLWPPPTLSIRRRLATCIERKS